MFLVLEYGLFFALLGALLINDCAISMAKLVKFPALFLAAQLLFGCSNLGYVTDYEARNHVVFSSHNNGKEMLFAIMFKTASWDYSEKQRQNLIRKSLIFNKYCINDSSKEPVFVVTNFETKSPRYDGKNVAYGKCIN